MGHPFRKRDGPPLRHGWPARLYWGNVPDQSGHATFHDLPGLNGEIRGLNSVGLRRRGFSDESINLLRDAHRKIWRSDGPTSEVLTQIETESGSNTEIQTLLDFLRASGKGKMGRAREGGENGSPNKPQPEANLSE